MMGLYPWPWVLSHSQSFCPRAGVALAGKSKALLSSPWQSQGCRKQFLLFRHIKAAFKVCFQHGMMQHEHIFKNICVETKSKLAWESTCSGVCAKSYSVGRCNDTNYNLSNVWNSKMCSQAVKSRYLNFFHFLIAVFYQRKGRSWEFHNWVLRCHLFFVEPYNDFSWKGP